MGQHHPLSYAKTPIQGLTHSSKYPMNISGLDQWERNKRLCVPLSLKSWHHGYLKGGALGSTEWGQLGGCSRGLCRIELETPEFASEGWYKSM